MGSALLVAPVAGTAQQVCGGVSIPRMRDGLNYYDAIERLYKSLDSTFVQNGEERLSGDMRDRFEAVKVKTTVILERLTNGHAERQLPFELYENLGAYWDFVRAAFADSVPSALEMRVCPIRVAYLDGVKEQLIDHGRKLSLRYGEGSERLNIFEMLLNEWTTSRAPVGKLRDPSGWEWILRAQTLGYQYRRSTRALEPSFPVFQLGFTRYFYGTGSVSRTLHHLGLAAAYQRDVTNRRNLVGAMLHVQQFDVGVLCATGCRDHVVVASKNLSLAGDAWTRMRKALGQ